MIFRIAVQLDYLQVIPLYSFYIYIDLNEDGTEKPINSTETNTPSYAPIVIRIDFKLEDPRAGIVFVEPDDDIAPYVSLFVGYGIQNTGGG
jgi:hypothetical protein